MQLLPSSPRQLVLSWLLLFSGSSLAAQSGTAVVRHAASIAGTVDGSLQQTTTEPFRLDGSAVITRDLLVPGTPAVRTIGSPTLGGVADGNGNPAPSTYEISISGNATLSRIVRRTEPALFPVLPPAIPPAGTRSLLANSAAETIGSFATLRDLALAGSAGQIAVPPGAYGEFTAAAGNGFTLGSPGATMPAVYHFQKLTLHAQAELRVIGPVVVHVAGPIVISGTAGTAATPGWLALNARSDVTVSGGGAVHGFVTVPDHLVVIDGAARLIGGLAADRLIIRGGGLLRLTNRPPVANGATVSVAEDASIQLLLTASDADGDRLVFTVTSLPAHGMLTGTAPNLTYTPAPNYAGADAFSFKVNDGSVDSPAATITVMVAAVNDPPVAESKTLALAEDDLAAVTLAGADVDGDALRFEIVAAPVHGVLAGDGDKRTYTPAPNYNGRDSFTYVATDGVLRSDPAAVAITISPVNDPPVAMVQTVAAVAGLPLAIIVTGTDPDGDTLTYSVVSGPTRGTLAGSAPNLTYTAPADFSGPDTFAFKASDGRVDSAPATVTIAVAPPPNRPPRITSSPVASMELRAELGGAGILRGTIRDFSKSHPNFEETMGYTVWVSPELVAPFIGADRKPVPYKLGQAQSGTDTAANFNQWYRDVPGVNFARDIELPIAETAPGSGNYSYRSDAFFPIDNEFYGSEGLTDGRVPHNFNFTCEYHTQFVYQPGQSITFGGDDALWVFVDDRLVIDLGGVHVSVEATASLDGLGLVPGRVYPMDIFHAEQHTGGSSFRLRTSMAFETSETYRYSVQAADPDGGALTYALTQAPAGMTIDPTSGVIAWIVDRQSSGSHPVTVQARDPGGLTATQSYALHVYANTPPTITWPVRYQVGQVGVPVPVAATVTDDGFPANQALAISWTKLSGPGDVTFAPATAASTAATFSAAGIYVVQLRAHDGSRETTSTTEVRIDLLSASSIGRQATSWWPGNDTPEDVIGGRHAATLNGVGYSAGVVGSAFVFDGVNDMARVRANPDLDLGTAPNGFSIEFWMRCEIDSPMGAMLGWRTVTGESGPMISLDNYLGGRRLSCTLRRPDGTEVGVGGEQLWAPNQWVHLAFTYDCTSGVARIYRDGGLKREQVVGPLALKTTMDLWWGCLSGVNGGFFRGRIDELAIYRRPLSAGEVYAGFAAANAGHLPPSGNQPPAVDAGPDVAARGVDQPILLHGAATDDGRPKNATLKTQWACVSGPVAPAIAAPASLATAVTLPAAGTYVFRLTASDGEAVSEDLVQVKAGQFVATRPEGLVGWWPGNDRASELVRGLHGTWSNAPQYAAGAVSTAFTFDGQRRVSVPASPELSADGWTGLSLEFWLRPTTPASGNGWFLGWRDPSGTTGVTLRVGYSWGWLLAVDLPDTTGNAHSFSVPGLALDQWQHFVVAYDRATGVARVYRNGVQSYETALGSFTPRTALDLHWGNVTDASFRGGLDELSIYRRALAGDEAYALYQAGSAGKEPVSSNQPPVVSAGPDRLVRGISELVTLAGTVSDDSLPAGNGLAVRWTKLSGPGSVAFDNPAGAATSATFDQPGIHVLRLEADDGLTRASDLVEVRIGPFAVADPGSDLIAWWTANHTTDEVVGGQHAQWVGPPEYTAAGSVGAAFAFNGNRYLRVPAGPRLNAANWPGLSVEFWVRPSGMSTSSTAALLQWRHASGQTGVAIEIGYRWGWNLSVNLADTSGQPHAFGVDGALVENVWQHLLITYDRTTGRAQAFRNGRLAGESQLGSFTPQTGYDLLIGDARENRFLGGIDEVAIHRRALAPAEAAAIYAAGSWGRARPADNAAPAVNAGPDLLLASARTPAALNGSVTDDGRPFGTLATFWSVASAPEGATVTFADVAQPATTVTASTAGTYLLRLTANDGYAPAQSDTVEMRIAPGAVDTPADIAAWWPGNASPLDVIGRHDAEMYNGAGYAAGRVLQGFAFDGAGSFVRVEGHADLNIGASAQGMTVEFWTRWDVAGDRPLFTWMSADGGAEYVRGWTSYGGRMISVWLRGTDGQDRTLSGPATLAPGQFVHVALTYDRTSGVGRLYYDGSVVDERNLGVFTPDTAAARRLWIGSRHDNRTFKGIIDEFALYRRALAPAEIRAITVSAQNGKSPPDENAAPGVYAGPDVAVPGTITPVTLAGVATDDGKPFGPLAIQWRMLTGPGAVNFANANSAATTATFDQPGTYLLELAASDGLLAPVSDTVEVRVGVALAEPPAQVSAWWPGNLHGAEIVAGNAPLDLRNGATYAVGRVLHGLSFDGNDDCGRAKAHADIDVGASVAGFSAEFWVRPAENRDGMVMSWGDASVVGLAVYQYAAGREIEVNFRDRSSGGDRTLRTTGRALTAGQWSHIALTHDRTTGEMRIYVNGVVRAISSLGVAAVRTQYGLTVGRNAWDAGFAWRGTLDELALYKRPLTPAEIAGVYAASGDGKSPPDQNSPPAVQAGADSALPNAGVTATLSGRVTDDNLPFGAPTVAWRMVAGPGSVTFGHPGAAATTATFSAAGTYLLELSGSDCYAAPVSDQVEVRVGVATAETPSGISAWWPANQHGAEVVNARAPVELMYGASYTTGRVLQGWAFDGVDDIGRVAAHADIDVGASAAGFTIEFWMKPAENRDGMIMSWGTANVAGLTVCQYSAGREIEVNFRDRSTGADRTLRTTGFALTAGQWTHIAITQDRASGEARIYVNGGQRVSSFGIGGAARSQHTLVLGRNAWDASSPWKGTLDELALYQRPLAPEEIQRVFAAGGDGKSLLTFNEPPLVSAGPDVVVAGAGTAVTLNGFVIDDQRPFGAPVVEWTAVDAPGAVTFADAGSARTSVNFGRAGTYLLKLTATDRFVLPVSDLVEVRVGTATAPLPPDVAAWWPANGHAREIVNGNRAFELLNGAGYGAGNVSQGFLFDGADDQARALAHADFHVGASSLGFTVEFWVRPDRVGQGDFPLVAWHSGNAPGLYVLASANGTQPSLYLRYAEGGATDIHPGTLLAGRQAQWVHLAYTYDRPTGVVRVYRDGALASQHTAVANRTVLTNYSLWLGRWPESGVFKGMLDELTLYRRPLTASEIATIYTAADAGKAPAITNQRPLAYAGTDQAGYTNAAIPLAGTAIDDGLPNPPGTLSYLWAKVGGPGGVVFSAATSAATTATFDAAGTHTLRFSASDSVLTSSDDVIVTVGTPASQPPAIAVVQPRHNAGLPAEVPVSLIASATDTDGTVVQVEFLRDGVSLGLAGPLEGRPGWYSLTTAFAATPSPITLAARATDNTGVVTTSAAVTVRILPDSGPPFAEITTPDEDARITAPTAIRGVAASPLLAGWTLERRLKAAEGATPEPWAAFASGNLAVGTAPDGGAPLAPETLGLFDPRLLLNGIHEVRLTATDTAGRSQVAGPITILVEGNLKAGAFTLAFEDLKIPAAGIPITLTRLYDSRDARVGDFGPGWRLAVNNIRVQKNRHLGTGWWQTPQQGSGLQFYHVEPVMERIVVVGMPDGETHRFRAGALVKNREGDPDNASFAVVARRGKYRFYPIGDTTSKLEPLNSANELAEDFFIGGTGVQDLTFDEFGFELFNATRFRLTSADGIVFIVDERLGLLEMRDTNGNTLVLGRDPQSRVTGVTATQAADGGPVVRTVMITRDPTGRVDYIRDPAGKELDYLYDPEGRLTSFVNRELSVTQFRYELGDNPSHPQFHYLTRVIDPRGIAALRSEYDPESGRLVKQIDAEGRETVFTGGVDAGGQFEKVKDRLGNETTCYYDDRGNVTLKVDPLGAQTAYRYWPDGERVKFETDHYGNVKGMAYDARGNVIAETLGASLADDPTSPTTGYTTRTAYNPLSAPTRITDPDGRVQTFTYDPTTNDLLTHTVGANPADATVGDHTTYTYNRDGTLATMTDALGNVTSYGHDYAFSDGAFPGATRQITVTITDPAGPAGSDASNTSDMALRSTRTLFDAQENQLAQIVRRTLQDGTVEAVVTRFRYDSEGRLTATIMPDGRVTETRYTSFGKQDKTLLWKSVTDYEARDDAKARVTSFGYDTRGNQTSVTYADGTNEQAGFDAEGRRAWLQDRRGYRTFFVFDAVGRLRFTVHPDANDGVGAAAPAVASDPRLADNPRSETQYDLVGRVRFQIDERGAKTEFTYEDGGGGAARRKQTIQHRGAGNLITQYAYDRAGNLRFVTDARGNTVETRYDDRGRPRLIVYPATDEHPATQAETKYDALGRRIEAIDQEGRSTRYRHDALGRLVEVRQYLDPAAAALDGTFSLTVTDPRLVSTRYGYDELGNQFAQIDALGRVTRYESDAVGRRTKRTLPVEPGEPAALSESLAYDGWGNVWKRTDFAGQTTTFGYDALNRLTSKSADPTHPSLGYSHASARIEFEYDQNGARTAARIYNRANTLLYAETTPRDERGRVEHKDAGAAGRLDYRYHANGLLQDVVSSNAAGVNIGYRYDELNRLESVEDASSGVPARSTGYTYNPNGALETVVQPNGIVHAYAYDALNRLRMLQVRVGAALPGGPPVGTLHHTYEYKLRPSGHRRQVGETLASAPGTLNAPRTTTYEYDALYRLVGETVAGDPSANNGAIGYALDQVGNRGARESTVAGVAPQPSLTYNARDWLNGDTYSPNGGTVQGQHVDAALRGTDAYDFEDRLIVRTRADGTSINIRYDADGHRVAKNILSGSGAPVSSTSWLVDTNNLTGYAQVFEERMTTAGFGATPGTSRRIVYTFGPDLISQSSTTDAQPTEVRYFTCDGHESTRELTSPNGSITDRYDYDAFGLLVSRSGATSNAHLYVGEQYDGDLGLYYLRARYWSPDAGRFWSMDAYEGGSSEPISLHKYAYGNANPVTYRDPSGYVSLAEVQVGMVIVGTLNSLALNSGRNTISQANGIFSPSGGLNTALATFEQAAFIYDQVSLAVLGGGVSVLGKRILEKGWRTLAPQLAKAATTLQNASPGKLIQAQLGRFQRATATGARYATRYEPTSGVIEEGAEMAPGRVFWSGGSTASDAAQAWARANGATTLEMTAAGQRVAQATKGLDWLTEAKPMWQQASADFARGAQGEVHVFQSGTRGVSLESVWHVTEYPILQEQGNTFIYHVINSDGIMIIK